METKKIESLKQLRQSLSTVGRTYLLLYKSDSEASSCALENLSKTSSEENDFKVLTADVSKVRDIHPEFGIKSVPTLLEFDHGEYRNLYKGCNDAQVLKAIFDEAIYFAQMEKEGKTVKQVTVYSTPTCTWCTTLKNYLNKNKIRYRDVDISRDSSAAQELVSRSGQQGVPQTEIDGRWVVGFDESKLKTLLEIK